jgi:hypothetical protein
MRDDSFRQLFTRCGLQNRFSGPRTAIAIAGVLMLVTPLLLPRRDYAPQHERGPAQSLT